MTTPDLRSTRGLDCLTTIAGSAEGGRRIAGYFENLGALGSIAHLTAGGEIWARDAISRRDRSAIVITALAALGREPELRQHVGGGLNHGMTVDEIDEIMVQVAVYCGLPFAIAGARIVDDVVAEREGNPTRTTPRSKMEAKPDAERRAAGLDVLSTLLGHAVLDKDAMAESILANQGDMGALVMDYAFGDVWSRPQLSRRDRSLIVVSALTALNMTHELEFHIRAGLNHGLTTVEIDEIMVTMVAYGGFPRAIDGLLVARKVFAAHQNAANSRTEPILRP